MTAALVTLPGTLPELLRRGAPVLWRDEETPYVVTGTYTDADGAAWVIAAPCAGIPLGVQDDTSNFALDLSDPIGTDIAARWLAERVGLTVGTTAPEWRYHSDPAGAWWRIKGADGQVVFFVAAPVDWARTTRAGARVVVVPALNGVTDPAAALAVACLAVGGAS